ncbi:MAG TPA: hypothetical protein VLC08_13080 [Chitinolyticbacter sp.]|nr:hypothetical protein [Chitinolyticbacter sp.]
MSTPLDGAWELLGGHCDDHGATLHYESLGMRSRKLLASGYFTFVSHQGDKFWSSGSGRYTLDGEQYTETPDMGTFPATAMRPYVFRARVQGDVWHNERWENGVCVEVEHWRRIGS